MDGDAATHGDEAENIIAIDGMAALRQFIIDAFEVFINHEHIAVVLQKLLVRIFIFKVFGTLGGLGVALAIAQFKILLNHGIGIEPFVSNVFIEIGGFFVAHFLDELRHEALFHLNFLVLKTALQQLFGIEPLFGLRLFQCKTNFRFRLACLHDVEPIALGALVVLSEYLYGIARMEHLAEAHVLAVDTPSHATAAHIGMNVIGKVEQRGTLWKIQ